MANIKFSAFTQKVVETDVDFLVGYTGADNVRISPSTIGQGVYLPLAGGTMTGNILLEDSVKLSIGTSDDFNMFFNGVDTTLQNITGDLNILNKANDRDINLQTDNGSGGVATYIKLDGSTTDTYFLNPGNVGIGTASPSYKFTAYGSSSDSEIVASFGSANDISEYTAIGLSGFIAGNDATKAGLALERTASFGVGKLHFLNNTTIDDSDMTLSDSRMVIDIDGNVGVGTTSPSSFNSRGRNLVVNSDGDTGITISANSTSSSTLLFADAFAGTGGTATYRGVVEYDHSNDSMAFSTSATEKMRVDSSGTLLINSTSTVFSDKLYVNSNAYTTGGWRVGTAGTYVGQLVNDSGKLTLTSDASRDISFNNVTQGAIMFLEGSNGNVGIGTTSPNRKLSIGDGTGSPNIQLLASTVGNSRIEFGDTDDTDAGEIQYVHSSNYMQFTTNGTEKMRIDSSGNVGIGTTNPGAKLEVVGSGTAAIFGDGTRAFKIYTDADEVSLLAEGSVPMKFYTSGAEKMRITSAGNVGIGTSSPASKLEVDGGDVEITDSLNGLILKSPDGTRYRVTVANGGTLTVSAA